MEPNKNTELNNGLGSNEYKWFSKYPAPNEGLAPGKSSASSGGLAPGKDPAPSEGLPGKGPAPSEGAEQGRDLEAKDGTEPDKDTAEKEGTASNKGRTLDEILKQQGISTEPDSAVDVVYGGAYSIRDYYMESGNPRIMRGASQLLIDAAEECACAAKSFYFSCGAEHLFVAPSGKGEESKGKKYAKDFESKFREVTYTAQAVAVYRHTTVGELRDDEKFGKLWADLNADFSERRMLRFFPLDEADDGTERCPRCNFRKPKFPIPDSDEKLCESCTAKFDKGGAPLRNAYQEKCWKYGLEHGIVKAEQESEYVGANDTYESSDAQGDIALIYADINNLGGAGRELGGNAEKRREFTEAVQDTAEEALYTAVLKGLAESSNHKFELIAVGGDDMCVLVPGEIGLLAGTLLTEEFDKKWKKCGGGFLKLTISVGIALGQYNTPIFYMRETAEQLLKIAKGLAHDTEKSCLDILSLNSDGQWATRVEDKLRRDLKIQEGGAKAIRTVRPFTSESARQFLGWLKKADAASSSSLHRIAEASMKLGMAEGDLWFEYLLSRQPEHDQSLKNLCNAIAKDRAAYCAMYFKGESGRRFSPWRDLAEFRQQKHG
jgi:ribosomal 50S subunit-associated protein YjgA (DUF615 family)